MSSALLETYRALIGSGELTHDADQERVIGALNDLCGRLETYEVSRRRGGLASLFSSRVEAPDGIYLYGGVGRGKTMLMDLFHDTAPVNSKRRVHFHEFMQEVHGRVHDQRQAHSKGYVKEADPIPPVADRSPGVRGAPAGS